MHVLGMLFCETDGTGERARCYDVASTCNNTSELFAISNTAKISCQTTAESYHTMCASHACGLALVYITVVEMLQHKTPVQRIL